MDAECQKWISKIENQCDGNTQNCCLQTENGFQFLSSLRGVSNE